MVLNNQLEKKYISIIIQYFAYPEINTLEYYVSVTSEIKHIISNNKLIQCAFQTVYGIIKK